MGGCVDYATAMTTDSGWERGVRAGGAVRRPLLCAGRECRCCLHLVVDGASGMIRRVCIHAADGWLSGSGGRRIVAPRAQCVMDTEYAGADRRGFLDVLRNRRGIDAARQRDTAIGHFDDEPFGQAAGESLGNARKYLRFQFGGLRHGELRLGQEESQAAQDVFQRPRRSHAEVRRAL